MSISEDAPTIICYLVCGTSYFLIASIIIAERKMCTCYPVVEWCWIYMPVMTFYMADDITDCSGVLNSIQWFFSIL